MSVTNADPTHLSPFPLEQCSFMSGAPKQSQATNLGQHIYCTWINMCLSAVNFVPSFITFRYRVSPDHFTSPGVISICCQRAYMNIPGRFQWSGEASAI